MIMIISFVYPRQYWFIALIGPSKCLKQIFQMKVNRVKNPNWPETNQLAILQAWSGIRSGLTENKSSWRSGWDLNSARPNFKSSVLISSAMLPPYWDVMVLYNSKWDLWLKSWFLMKQIKNGAFRGLQRYLYFVTEKKTLDFNWFKTLQLFWKPKWKKSLRWKVGISFLPAFRNFFHPFFFLPKNTKIPSRKTSCPPPCGIQIRRVFWGAPSTPT